MIELPYKEEPIKKFLIKLKKQCWVFCLSDGYWTQIRRELEVEAFRNPKYKYFWFVYNKMFLYCSIEKAEVLEELGLEPDPVGWVKKYGSEYLRRDRAKSADPQVYKRQELIEANKKKKKRHYYTNGGWWKYNRPRDLSNVKQGKLIQQDLEPYDIKVEDIP